jgi:hypothetical protein
MQDRRHDAGLRRPHCPPAAELDNDADFVSPEEMLAELHDDNKQLVAILRLLPRGAWSKTDSTKQNDPSLSLIFPFRPSKRAA